MTDELGSTVNTPVQNGDKQGVAYILSLVLKSTTCLTANLSFVLLGSMFKIAYFPYITF